MGLICSNCGTVDSVKFNSEGTNKKGKFLLLLIVSVIIGFVVPVFGLIVFVIGVLVLAFSKQKRDFRTCKACLAENSFVGTDTPKGKQLLEQYHTDKNGVLTIQQETKKQSWHGLW